MRNARVLLAALAVLVIGGTAVPTYAGTAQTSDPIALGGDDTIRAYRISRTSAMPRRLVASIEVRSSREDGAILGVGLVRTKYGDWTWDNATTSPIGYQEIGAGDLWGHAYGPNSTPGCPDRRACTNPLGDALAFDLDSETAKLLDYFIVTVHTTATLTIDSPGWRLRAIPASAFRRVMKEDAQATGVDLLHGHAEVFTAAEAAGGRYGSFAVAVLPCERAGQGEAYLTGGYDPEAYAVDPGPTKQDRLKLWCDAPDYWRAGQAAQARRATKWRLTGDVVGEGDTNTRLAVFDYPRP